MCRSSFVQSWTGRQPSPGSQSAGCRKGTVPPDTLPPAEDTNSEDPHHVNESNYKLFNKERGAETLFRFQSSGRVRLRAASQLSPPSARCRLCSGPCPAAGISTRFAFLRQFQGTALLLMGQRVSASQQRFRERLLVKTLTLPGEQAAVLRGTS